MYTSIRTYIYVNVYKYENERRMQMYTSIRTIVVSWFIGWVYVAANLVRFLVIPVNGFQVSIFNMEFLTEKFSSWLKNSENCKIWNSHFQNFEKIDLIILANRSHRSNHKKSLNALDRFIGQRINKKHKICGKILTVFIGFLRTNTVAAKRDLLAERTGLGKSVSVSLRKNGPYSNFVQTKVSKSKSFRDQIARSSK